ncbi:MAG: acyl-CoA/acyl-ACP dehydrogenase [Chloroflexi bacterium]|nr:acyl-CoA/acyl-ACP dehydrogenase [Chloroflexota bacterium]
MSVYQPDFGDIVDFDQLRQSIRHLYDSLLPDFNMHKSLQVGTELYGDDPSAMIAAGASMLAWMTIIAAGEDDIAEELKDSLFTLGWTEEEIGSDLLSATTVATPLNDDPHCVDYHLRGRKWLINNSYHADYHTIVAKTDPNSSGPRSLSIFLVPQSSCKNWERLETHVLRRMVLTSFDIDGPGRLLGKVGHGLQILQRMAMPSKYQCAYVGVKLLNEAIPASIEHLSKKRIFKENPINFSNVLRQMYNLVLQSAVLNFIYYRALAFSAGSFLQFHGVMLKSWLLLRANELLGQNLLVVGSKGFLAESVIGRNAIDSFVLPVFDGHYTINTLMTAKHAKRYLGAERRADVAERMATLRHGVTWSRSGDQIRAHSRKLRNPDFFDYAGYIEDLALPIDLDARQVVASMQALADELGERDLMNDPEHRYKLGTMLHWMEALLAACEMWKATEEEEFLNAVVMQYNAFVNQFNQIISESALRTRFLPLMRQRSLRRVEAPRDFLLRLYNLAQQFAAPREAAVAK